LKVWIPVESNAQTIIAQSFPHTLHQRKCSSEGVPRFVRPLHIVEKSTESDVRLPVLDRVSNRRRDVERLAEMTLCCVHFAIGLRKPAGQPPRFD